MEFLDYPFLENTIKDWAIALGIILGTFVATKIVYWFIANIIKKLTSKPKRILTMCWLKSLKNQFDIQF